MDFFAPFLLVLVSKSFDYEDEQEDEKDFRRKAPTRESPRPRQAAPAVRWADRPSPAPGFVMRKFQLGSLSKSDREMAVENSGSESRLPAVLTG